jgi:hypothetical protein
MTQRIFEAALAGCLPLTPAALPFAAEFTPAALHVDDGHQAARRIGELQAIAGTAEHAVLIGDCIGLLAIFRLSRQLAVIETILRRPAVSRERVFPRPQPYPPAQGAASHEDRR